MSIDGTSGNDSLDGTGGDDTINGLGGNDTLSGLGGVDVLNGGDGDDTLVFEYGNIGEANGGDGLDTLSLPGLSGVLGFAYNGLDPSAFFAIGNSANSGERVELSSIEIVALADRTYELVLGSSGADTLTVLTGLGARIYTGIGNDVVTGGSGDDWVWAVEPSTIVIDDGKYIDVAAGDDVVFGGLGDDTILGGAGSDSLQGRGGDDTLDGGGDNDLLLGGEGDDQILGGAGDDTIRAGLGSDDIDGQSGDDLIILDPRDVADNVANTHDTLDGGDGNDELRIDYNFASQTIELSAGPSGISFSIDDGATVKTGTAENFESVNFQRGTNLAGPANIILTGDFAAAGVDGSGATAPILFSGLSGGDLFDASGVTSSTYIRAFGNEGDDTLRGGAGEERLYGGDGADSISGGGGVDTLIGEAGDDILIGGAGNDLISGGDDDDYLEGGAGADLLAGDDGTDVADYSASGAGVTVNLFTGAGSGGDAASDTLVGIEEIIGSSHADSLTGDSGENALTGGDGDDTLYGGAGADLLDGGEGIDTASYEGAGAGVSVNLAVGTASGGDAEGDTLSGIEVLIGSGHADSLVGGTGADQLEGAAGEDTIMGGLGDDTLTGGAGEADRFIFALGDGADIITDFDATSANGDVIELVGYEAVFATTYDVLAASVQDGADVVVTLGAGDSIRLQNVLLGDLDISHIRLLRDFDALTTANGQTLVFSGVDIDGYQPAYSGLDVTFNDDALVEIGAGQGSAVRVENSDSLVFDGVIDARRVGTPDEFIWTKALEFYDGDLTLNGAIYASGKGLIRGVEYYGPGASAPMVNNGLIDVYGAGNSEALGIFSSSLTTLQNNGDVNVLSTDIAVGIRVNSGVVENYGNLTVLGASSALGIYANDEVLNDGDIDVTSTDAIASGVYFFNGGTFTNTNNIIVTGVDAIGVEADRFSDVLTNSGNLIVEATGAGSQSIGIRLVSMDILPPISIINSGVISADIAIDAPNVFSNQTNGIQLIENSGSITGDIRLGKGDDQIDNAGGVIIGDIHLGQGNDFFDSSLGAINGVVMGEAGDDTLLGGGGNDSLMGGEGFDSIIGGGGDDSIDGGDGGGIYQGGDGADTIIGGSGEDLIGYYTSPAGVSVNLSTGVAQDGFGRQDTFSQIDGVMGSLFSDAIIGSSSDNFLRGRDGDDTLIGGAGGDTLIGDAGVDTASYEESGAGVSINLATGLGSGGDAQGDILTLIESLIGTKYGDMLAGDIAANGFEGGGGADTLYGDAGNDTLNGGGAADLIYGGDDDDVIIGDLGADELRGEAGNDTIEGGGGKDTLIGREGNDSLCGGLDDDRLFGGDGDDTLDGGARNDFRVSGQNGNDLLFGGIGVDEVFGGRDNDTLDAGGGDDRGIGGAGDDSVYGGAGDDFVTGGEGADTVDGANGNDTVIGGAGNDLLIGGAGVDSLTGGNDNDTLQGGNLNDTLKGQSGDDVLVGGNHDDSLVGGSGNDRFVFGEGDGADVIADFAAGAGSDDVILLEATFGPAFDEFAEVIAAASDDGTDTTINFGGGQTITLANVVVSDLHSDDFVFS